VSHEANFAAQGVTTPSAPASQATLGNTNAQKIAPASTAPPAAPHPFDLRLATGVLGVLIAAIMSGINGRVGAMALMDIRGALSLGMDEASWLTSVYSACELAAMPVSAWFAVTFSFRRYLTGIILSVVAIGLVLPHISNLPILIGLRGLQGFLAGLVIPLLMAAALRFLPLPLRLYGLSLYALTATFSPNLAFWLTSLWTDQLHDVRLVYLQIVPLGVIAVAAVAWGIPQDPVRLERFRDLNVFGLLTGVPGLIMLGIALTQGERLDWFNSRLICAFFMVGIPLIIAFLISEWYHDIPFMRLQVLHRRNLGLGFTVFLMLLVVMLSGSLLPADYLIARWNFRPEQLVIIGSVLALPQLILGPAVSWLLYRQWVDARKVFAAGLALQALACFIGSGLTPEWMAKDFLLVQALQAIGQPMAVVALLFLATSVAQPMEGPFVSGIVNTIRAFGTMLGGVLIGRFLVSREHFHSHGLADHAGNVREHTDFMLSQLASGEAASTHALHRLAEILEQQSLVLAISDAYLVLGVLALLTIPPVLMLQYIRPPALTTDAKT